jgi:hypothetical protein
MMRKIEAIKQELIEEKSKLKYELSIQRTQTKLRK